MWKYVAIAAITLFLLWAADLLSIFLGRVQMPTGAH
jgi:hypothetical protein